MMTTEIQDTNCPILVPVDFSANAMEAAHYALQFAQHSRRAVVLFHVLTLLQGGYSGEARFYTFTEERIARVAQKMHTLENDLRRQYPNVSIETVHANGFVTDELLKEINKGAYACVVLGTSGTGDKTEGVWGSTASELVEKSPIPVLTVPLAKSSFSPDRLLYFTSFDAQEIQALRHVERMFGTISPMHILHLRIVTSHSDLDSVSERWEAKVRDAMPHTDLTIHVVPIEKFNATSVENVLEEDPRRLLVFTKLHKSFLARFFGSSFTQKVSGHLHSPCLFLRNPAF